jgi:hypothetical protein
MNPKMIYAIYRPHPWQKISANNIFIKTLPTTDL